MADAGARVVREHSLEFSSGGLGTVGNDDHARVDGAADPDAAAVVNAHP